MLDLVRLSRRRIFPPGGVELYRQIALLTDMASGQDVLDVACGRGVSLEYFVREHGVVGSGVDRDWRLVEAGEYRAREGGMGGAIGFQVSSYDELPYRDAIFDVSIGEIGLTADSDPDRALAELVRVTRPGGFVVLVQLVWKAAVDDVRRELLAEHLGTRPLMTVDWKRHLRNAGMVDLHTEDWIDDKTAFRPSVAKPFPDFAEIFSFSEKVGILRRAWGRWGWRGIRAVLSREREIHKLLTQERILGLDLLRGRKPEAAPASPDPPGRDGDGPFDPPARGGDDPADPPVRDIHDPTEDI